MRMHRCFARGLAAGSCKIVKRNVTIVRHVLHQFSCMAYRTQLFTHRREEKREKRLLRLVKPWHSHSSKKRLSEFSSVQAAHSHTQWLSSHTSDHFDLIVAGWSDATADCALKRVNVHASPPHITAAWLVPHWSSLLLPIYSTAQHWPDTWDGIIISWRFYKNVIH